MKPATFNLEIYRGDSFSLFFRVRQTVWDGTAWVPGAYVDLTGWTGLAQYRADEDSTTVLETFTVAPGNQSSSPGSCFMTLTAAKTAALTTLKGVYDLQFTLPDGSINTYLKGSVTVSKDVSRSGS